CNVRAFFEADHAIARPVEARHAVLVERDLLEQHAARGLHELPDDLRFDDGRIDDEAGVDRAVKMLNRDSPRRLVDLDLGDRAAPRREMRAEADAAAADDVACVLAAASGPGRPPGRFGGGVEHAEPALVRDVPPAE